jgi:hypothetical protein
LPDKLNSFSNLVLVTQASGAQVKPFGLTIDDNGGWMNIRHPAPIGLALGMTDIMTELG